MSNSPEDQLVLDQLVYRVCRAFYEPKYIVVMDVINKLKQVKDEELAATLKLNRREIHKICGKLKEDRLIKDLTKMEARKPDQRAIPNTYYFLDYKMFVDVVKYKIHRMGKELDAVMSKQEVESAGYRCPACHNTYAMVDVVNNYDVDTGKFLCPSDNYALDDEAELTFACSFFLPLFDNVERLRENTKPIVDLLKLTDNIVIEQYTESMASKNAAARTHDDDDLAFAADGGQQQGEIQVVFQDDNDKAAKKAREAEAHKKRQQNALPSWHAWNAEEYYAKMQGEGESFETTDTNHHGSKRVQDDSEDGARKRHKAEDESFDISGAAEDEEEGEEYPDVSVAGVMVPLLEITEEHQSQMTPEEYQAYYDICQQLQ
ncbi:hypothetical protein BGX34_000858 [Mortierella sp. NVP85]|nr:hypothetical protein BGX34_000858 [Mortierella sp. NVP85]